MYQMLPPKGRNHLTHSNLENVYLHYDSGLVRSTALWILWN